MFPDYVVMLLPGIYYIIEVKVSTIDLRTFFGGMTALRDVHFCTFYVLDGIPRYDLVFNTTFFFRSIRTETTCRASLTFQFLGASSKLF